MSENQWGWETFFETVAAFLERSSREMSSASEAYSDYVVERMQHCLRSLNYIHDTLSPPYNLAFSRLQVAILEEYYVYVDEIIEVLRSLMHQWELHIDSLQTSANDYSYHLPTIRTERRGRPRFDIGMDQLVYLSSLNFSWNSISLIMGVSRMTIYRRRREFNMLGDASQHISDAQLMSSLQEIQHNYPAMGEVMVLGHLRALGYRVNRDRVRRALRTIDPISSALRGPRGITARRPYSVPGPNSLWHIGMLIVTFASLINYSSTLILVKPLAL